MYVTSNGDFRKNLFNWEPLTSPNRDIEKCTGQGLESGYAFHWLCKAFDTVNHTMVLEKLKAIAISGDLLSWLDDYMSARKLVQTSGYQSEPKTIAYGVPWGSILEPKLFSVFVNDLPESITSGDLFMFLAKGSGIRFLVRDQGVQVDMSEVEGGHDPWGNQAASSYWSWKCIWTLMLTQMITGLDSDCYNWYKEKEIFS